MTAIRRREPDVGLEVFTRIPEWFFSEALSAPVFYHSITTDVGFVQKDPFVADIPETLDRLESFLPFSKPLVRELAANLTARKCRAVVCDISPLGIAVARAAGVPSILMENFTWDHLYSSYCDAYPAFEPFMKMLATWFSAVDVHIQTEPVCRLQPGRRLLHPISRPPKQEANAVRKALGVSDDRPLVLVTMGGVAARCRFAHHLEKMPRALFVLPHDVPEVSINGNVISLPHHSAFYHPDLIHAADLVIGKLGYSTLAEAGHAGKPFGYITRRDCLESDILADYAQRHIRGRAIAEADMASGRWIESLNALLELKSGSPAFPNDADRAASLVLDAASGTIPTAFVPAVRGFDPFNDRTSRDIRNRLSEAFVTALERLDAEPVRREADFLTGFSTRAHGDYIEDRVRRYLELLHHITANRIRDSKHQAVLIWNSGLFFECHEHLETLWLNAEGKERKALQGLIKAAGVFVHRELGRENAAEKLSPKAVSLLEACRKQLFFIANLEDLLSALKKNGAKAPKLKGW